MTMAHDPTRSWPTGKGPDDTSIPGAAWLELLDGQAFPVVGAGVMVRDGNVWTPASSSNPLHVRAQALEQLIGALTAAKETNPDAASASMLALLRGLIAIVGKEATLGQILAALGAPAQESTLVDVLAALTTLAGTIDSGAQKVTLTGQLVEDVNGAPALRTKQAALAYESWDFDLQPTSVMVTAGTSIEESQSHKVNGFSTLAVAARAVNPFADRKWRIRARWQSTPGLPSGSRSTFEYVIDHSEEPANFDAAVTDTKSQYVFLAIFNDDTVDQYFHVHGMLRV